MTLLLIIGASLAIIIAAVAIPLVGLRRLAVAGVLVSLALLPYPLQLKPDLDVEHHGITDPFYVPYTYTAMIAVCVIVFARERGVAQWLVFTLGIGAYMTILSLTLWSGTSQEFAGIGQIVTALAAFAAGLGIGQFVLRDPLAASLWAWTALMIVVVQLALMVAQFLGYPLGLYSTTAYFVAEHRPVGTTIHPSVPGKIILLLLPSLFVLTRTASLRLQTVSWAAVVGGVGIVALTQSRSNLAAILVAIMLWVVLDRRLSRRQRLISGIALAVFSVPIAAATIPRFMADPEGGDRAALLQTAAGVIPRYFWQGLGVNSYSAVVGQYDALARDGFPVHVTFLHLLAELGLVGALLVQAPIVAALVMVVLCWRRRWPSHEAALALAVTMPGVVLIYATGWGLLMQGVWPLWFLSLGASIGMMLVRDPVPSTQAPSRLLRWRRGKVRSEKSALAEQEPT